MGNKFQNLLSKSSNENAACKKPPLPHDYLERTPYHGYKSTKTPNKINSSSNIANVQIDLNSLLSDSELDTEKPIKKFTNDSSPHYIFESSEPNPLKKINSEGLFNEEDNNNEGILALALKDIFSEMAKQPEKKFFIRCSYLEIYTDLVYDLLKDPEHMTETLSIGEDFNVYLFPFCQKMLLNKIERILCKGYK